MRKNPRYNTKKTLRKALYTALTSSGAAKTVTWKGTERQVRMTVKDADARSRLRALLKKWGIEHTATKTGVTVLYSKNVKKAAGRTKRPSRRTK